MALPRSKPITILSILIFPRCFAFALHPKVPCEKDRILSFKVELHNVAPGIYFPGQTKDYSTLVHELPQSQMSTAAFVWDKAENQQLF